MLEDYDQMEEGLYNFERIVDHTGGLEINDN
jgi:hypothetical protein